MADIGKRQRTMKLNEYQRKAMGTCMDSCDNLAYMLTGLTAEVGEVNDKIAKAIRRRECIIDGNEAFFAGQPICGRREELLKEIGDCLWFIAGLAHALRTSLEDIAQMNLDKLADRAQRGVIDGSGDNR